MMDYLRPLCKKFKPITKATILAIAIAKATIKGMVKPQEAIRPHQINPDKYISGKFDNEKPIFMNKNRFHKWLGECRAPKSTLTQTGHFIY